MQPIQIEIASRLPDDTVVRETERHIEEFSAEELRICIAGEVAFLGVNGERLMGFPDVPLLGFAADLVNAVDDVLTGKQRTEWTDFYGEFAISLVREDGGVVEVANAFGGESFSTTINGLRYAVGCWVSSLVATLEKALPLTTNPNYPPIKAEVARLCPDENLA